MPHKTTSKTTPKTAGKTAKKLKPVSGKAVAKKPVARAAAKKVAPRAVPAKAVVKAKAVAKAPARVAAKAVARPVKPVAKKAEAVKVAAKPAVKPVEKVEKKAVVAARPAAPVAVAKTQYKVGVHVVYPTHGVGKIIAEETQMIGDIELRMLVIAFDKDKMTLRVPVHRATAAGLRPVSSLEQMKKVFLTLKGRARTSRGMWSRRAQEYETKINSGNIFSIAEVVRDLHQNVDQSERSYSERMIYESALSRLVGELAAAEGTDHKVATDKLMKLLRSKVAAAAALKEAA
jgi:CarD family transcriptional regulator